MVLKAFLSPFAEGIAIWLKLLLGGMLYRSIPRHFKLCPSPNRVGCVVTWNPPISAQSIIGPRLSKADRENTVWIWT